MISSWRKVLLNRWVYLPIALLSTLSACATPIVMNRPASDCSTLIPQTLRNPTEGATLPADQTVGAWLVFGDAQTGQLEKANEAKKASIEIIEACEQRDREATAKITKKPWWDIL